jgi:uncharacterized protein (TIGR03000 family)
MLPAGTARILLNVPENAKVYLVGKEMKSTGKVRLFDVPSLESGKSYDYPIKVTVVQNGRELSTTASQTLRVGDKLELTCQVNGESLAIQSPAAKADVRLAAK